VSAGIRHRASSRRIRVGIDGRHLARHGTAFCRYVTELCKALDAAMPHAEFFVYSPFRVRLPVGSDRWVARADSWPLNRRIPSVVWLKARLGSLCRRDSLDSFWSPVNFLPVLSAGVKTVVSVHDIVHLVTPRAMSFSTNLPLFLFFERDVRRADMILTNSQGTAARLYQALGCRAAGIVRPAVSSDFRPRAADEIRRCREKFGIDAAYILGVGISVRRKNADVLIRAFAGLKRDAAVGDHILVLAGPKPAKDHAFAALLERHRDCVKALGYVPEEDLPALYSGASVFAYPSLYEGFGMPVLEARACGVRVVASDLPELREAGGDQPIYVQPTIAGVRQGTLEALRRQSPMPVEGSQRPTWAESVKPLAEALAP
jgi:glycosyltransferase involved in cell wall biosynthesis